MEFTYSDKVKALEDKLGAFMDQHIYPNEERYEREVESSDRWPLEPVPAGWARRGTHQSRICTVVRDHGPFADRA